MRRIVECAGTTVILSGVLYGIWNLLAGDYGVAAGAFIAAGTLYAIGGAVRDE